MDALTEQSRATLEYELNWQSVVATHTDCSWAPSVSMWRDCFPEKLHDGLLGAREGDRVIIKLSSDAFHQPYSKDKIVRVKPGDFVGRGMNGRTIEPRQGRFYPQSFLRGVADVFPESILPCRFLGQENSVLSFDLNHPLSPYPLEITAHVREIHPRQIERGGRCEDWLESISAGGPGMQARYQGAPTMFFDGHSFGRADESDDSAFYAKPRFVGHVDRTAEATLVAMHARYLQSGMRVLDLMGSWTSHLPEELQLQQLTVLGLNREEIARNSRATDILVRDLNRDPVIPVPDNTYDAVLCSLSVEYLTRPFDVFGEVARVLKKGGLFLVSFSNRWFPPKVVHIWSEIHEFERIGLVLELFRASGLYTELHSYSRRGLPRPKDDPHYEYPLSDPVFMVKGKRG